MAEKDDKDDEGKIDLSQLTEVLKGLPENVQAGIKDAIKEASGEQRAAAQAAAAAAKANEDDDDEDDLDPDFDVERSSRTDLVNHLDKRFAKALNKALKPIIERLEITSTDAETDRVRREFGEAREKYPDFMEWKDEMRDIITAHPDLSASRIYRLARSENPEKAKEVDKKMKEEKGDQSDESKVVSMKAFGGLAPTSGSRVENNGKKQPKEAAAAAWDQAMGEVPASLFGEALEG